MQTALPPSIITRMTCLVGLLGRTLVAVVLCGSLRAELSPEVQSVLKKGVIAGQQQDFPLALRYFEEAHRAAPDAPEIYFNLGLAESKIPGRELRAIAWFGAYLSANPAAPNARAIRDQLEVLEVKQQGNIAKLLRLAEEAAGKLHEQPDDYSGKWQKLEYVAWQCIFSGDMSSAQRIAALLKGQGGHTPSILALMAKEQAEAGDLPAARKTLEAFRSDGADIHDLSNVATVQLKLGDQAGARKSLALAAQKAERMSAAEEGPGLVAPWSGRSDKLKQVVEEQVKAGDPAGAEKTLGHIERKPRSNSYRLQALAQVALGFAKAGNAGRAKKFLSEAQELSGTVFTKEYLEDYYFGKSEKCDYLTVLAETQARLGDRASATALLASARQTVDSIQDPSWHATYLLELARRQAALADEAGARDSLSAMETLIARSPQLESKCELTAKRRAALYKLDGAPANQAAALLARLEDEHEYSNCPLHAAFFLDLAAYMNSVPTDTPERTFDGIFKAAEKYVQARNGVRDLLKPAGLPSAK